MLGLSKPPGERERAKPFRILIVPGGVYAGGGTVFASGNPISQSKNRFLAIFACVAQRREQKLERVAGGAESAGFCGFAKGETATAQIENLRRGTRRGRYSPVRQLVKNTF